MNNFLAHYYISALIYGTLSTIVYHFQIGWALKTLDQHQINNGSHYSVCWEISLRKILGYRGQKVMSNKSKFRFESRVVVSTAAFHARVRGSVPGLGGLKETKMFLPHPRVKVSIVGSLRDRELACSASDRHSSNFESCVWRTVSSQSSHHPQEVLLAQFSLYVHKGGLKPDSFHFVTLREWILCPYQ